jgi:hypothetical protein
MVRPREQALESLSTTCPSNLHLQQRGRQARPTTGWTKPKPPSYRIKGHRIPKEEIAPSIDKWRQPCFGRHYIAGLHGHPFAHRKRIAHRSFVQRRKPNGDLGPPFHSFHHLGNPVRVRVGYHYRRNRYTLPSPDVHLWDTRIDKARTTISPCAVDAETHARHGPVSRIFAMCQPRIEVGECKTSQSFVRQAERDSLRRDGVATPQRVSCHVLPID